jgi:hypothetical protein
MIRTGLVSVTFRQLSAEEIIKLVVCAGLEGIEWGGDIHVPHGDLKRSSASKNAHSGFRFEGCGVRIILPNRCGASESGSI